MIDIGVQNNAAQHWWYSTLMMANTISNTDKIAKWYIQGFLVKMVVGNLINQTPDEGTCHQNAEW